MKKGAHTRQLALREGMMIRLRGFTLQNAAAHDRYDNVLGHCRCADVVARLTAPFDSGWKGRLPESSRQAVRSPDPNDRRSIP